MVQPATADNCPIEGGSFCVVARREGLIPLVLIPLTENLLSVSIEMKLVSDQLVVDSYTEGNIPYDPDRFLQASRNFIGQQTEIRPVLVDNSLIGLPFAAYE